MRACAADGLGGFHLRLAGPLADGVELPLELAGGQPGADVTRPRIGNERAHFGLGRVCAGQHLRQGVLSGPFVIARAISRDPSYAMAHAALALAYGEIASGQGGGALSTEAAYQRAREAVTRALALDSSLGEAHAVSALLRMVHDFDWAGAEAEFELALELSPGAADIDLMT